MSTQIKKNGNWVTVAGGTRMWVGTKAALQAALNAGELVDGTAVMVTDDYEEAKEVRRGTSSSVTISAGYFSTTVGITFDSPMPDANYEVILYNTQSLGSQWSDFIPCVKSKTVNGFEVQFNTLNNTPVASGNTLTCNIAYTAFKL